MNPSQAAPDARSQQEIAGLLTFVASSGCLFIRNGSEYPATEARDHLQKKLDYLNKKGLVDSSEDFIARAATESSMSGKPYKVRCNGQEQLSAEWLKAELARLRTTRP
ncbi:YfeK family protein [Pseudomonas sp. No.21]|nr:hypothetical protein TUM20249_56190 [Pseudomonas tohonis]